MKVPKEESRTYTVSVCDFCGVESWHRVKGCSMCKRDICSQCAIFTDSECLKEGSFWGDYPDYYCEQCWEIGKPFIEKIHNIRNEAEEKEGAIMNEWREAIK